MKFRVASKVVAFNFDFPVEGVGGGGGGGHVNIVDYSHKGTAPIYLIFQNVTGFWRADPL